MSVAQNLDAIHSDRELLNLLQDAANDTNHSVDFFSNSEYVAKLFSGDFAGALRGGLNLLARCQQLDPSAFKAIHKGTPFYWLGTAAFLVHDFQTAVFFYDAAVSEDLRTKHTPDLNPTPALRFMLIEGEAPDQAARPLVKTLQTRIEAALNDYGTRPGHGIGVLRLKMEDIRSRLLRASLTDERKALRSLASAFLSFFLEWDYRAALLALREGEGTAEPFLIHLFKGCLLFESLLKENNVAMTNQTTLGPLLNTLSGNLGLPKQLNLQAKDLKSVIKDFGKSGIPIKDAVTCTGKVRNAVGHQLGWDVSLDKSAYDAVASNIAASCLHVIARLYK